MITLNSIGETLKITTSAATNVDWYIAGYARKAGNIKTEFSDNGQITTATTTSIRASTQTEIKESINYMSITNLDAVTSNTVSVLFYDGTNTAQIHKAVLAAGEKLEFIDGWF